MAGEESADGSTASTGANETPLPRKRTPTSGHRKTLAPLLPVLPVLPVLPEMDFRWQPAGEALLAGCAAKNLGQIKLIGGTGGKDNLSTPADTSRYQSTPVDWCRLASTGIDWYRPFRLAIKTTLIIPRATISKAGNPGAWFGSHIGRLLFGDLVQAAIEDPSQKRDHEHGRPQNALDQGILRMGTP